MRLQIFMFNIVLKKSSMRRLSEESLLRLFFFLSDVLCLLMCFNLIFFAYDLSVTCSLFRMVVHR